MRVGWSFPFGPPDSLSVTDPAHAAWPHRSVVRRRLWPEIRPGYRDCPIARREYSAASVSEPISCEGTRPMSSRLELTRFEKSSRPTRTLPCAAETLPSTGLTSLEMFGQQMLITDLQKRMIESIQLRGMSKRTEEAMCAPCASLPSIITNHANSSLKKNSDSISCTSRVSRTGRRKLRADQKSDMLIARHIHRADAS